ncbi:hypothetical protein B0T17DRAFT_508798 [Bombardia bombarda]|uniref:Uncharacterized protein n=1 Tax=Bombardia bombarda TaxID=252184 RepID=A0AA39WTQ8_9PEZI|nr:hypothetical protein B0T17DRAFT_508798 [Bombardia bombarda]
MATNGSISHSDPTTEAGSSANSATSGLPKDEVGWYFVEQYYTTLSKSPEKLHLFYGKKSQFVYGQEAEVTPVSLGRPAIQERIKDLNFQNCKVRISNVDSQASGECIVIQVIGETSNDDNDAKKFVQTFVLASQPSGYFVLNDILRYINEDVEEETVEEGQESGAPAETTTVVDTKTKTKTDAAEVEAAPAETEVALPEKTEEAIEEQEPVELDAVDQKLAEAVTAVEETPGPAAETPAEEVTEEVAEETKDDVATETLPDPEKAVEEIAEEEVKKPEDPKAPTPTPAAAPVTRSSAPAPAEPEKPSAPPKPMTWASRAAAAAGPRAAAVAIPKTATPPAPTQSRAPAPAAASQTTTAPRATEGSPAPSVNKDQGSEWQTAETKRQKAAQSVTGAPEKEGTMAYIKYVTDKVKDDDLKDILAGFGELAYFDINRQKNCAFVEFKTQAGYAAAIAANPHTVNGESILVEQRRPKANAYGGSNYTPTRGVTATRGRGGFEGGRSGSQGAGRGGFTGQARGRGGAARGRGAPSSQVGA